MFVGRLLKPNEMHTCSFSSNVGFIDYFELGCLFPKRPFCLISHEPCILKLCNDIRTLIYQPDAAVRIFRC